MPVDGLTTYYGRYDSPVGPLWMAAGRDGLCGLWFEGQWNMPREACHMPSDDSSCAFDAVRRWLDCYFGGGVPDFTPALQLSGTPFQRMVWSLLLEIPYGHTVTYGGLAARIAGRCGLRSMSAQAVGNAVGRNPVSVIVPCHRVVGQRGKLTGYAGGLQRKAFLLALEGASAAPLF